MTWGEGGGALASLARNERLAGDERSGRFFWMGGRARHMGVWCVHPIRPSYVPSFILHDP